MLRLKISPFVWDGSHLGSYSPDIIHWTHDTAGLHYYCLTISQITIVCLAKQVKDKFSAIADEMKPIFGLPKLGTHTILLGSKLILLISCSLVDGQIHIEPTLSSVDQTVISNLKGQVMKIFAFREILGLRSSFESSIRIRKGKDGLYPISFLETSSLVEDEKVALPATIVNKWFDKLTVSAAVKVMLGCDVETDLISLMADLRKKIEEVIWSIDPDFIFYSAYICARLQSRLEASSITPITWQLE